MRIAVVGTGAVGQALSSGFAELGHDVVVGTRDPAATAQREEWQHHSVPLMPLDEVAAGAGLVVNATGGAVSLEALREIGVGALAGKVLLDVSNPLDFSAGFPPTLSVKDTDSLAEQIQRAFPQTRVVKSLNTLTAALMLHPTALPDPDTSVFVAGDDAEARALVVGLLREAGWRDVVELGSLVAARGLEMWLPLWLQLMGSLGTAEFNLKIVR